MTRTVLGKLWIGLPALRSILYPSSALLCSQGNYISQASLHLGFQVHSANERPREPEEERSQGISPSFALPPPAANCLFRGLVPRRQLLPPVLVLTEWPWTQVTPLPVLFHSLSDSSLNVPHLSSQLPPHQSSGLNPLFERPKIMSAFLAEP